MIRVPSPHPSPLRGEGGVAARASFDLQHMACGRQISSLRKRMFLFPRARGGAKGRASATIRYRWFGCFGKQRSYGGLPIAAGGRRLDRDGVARLHRGGVAALQPLAPAVLAAHPVLADLPGFAAGGPEGRTRRWPDRIVHSIGSRKRMVRETPSPAFQRRARPSRRECENPRAPPDRGTRAPPDR
jgi:hypothetical protein